MIYPAAKEKKKRTTGYPSETAEQFYYETPQSRNIDIIALEKALSGALEGEVRFDAGSKALYATDASNYRQVPIGVVIPRSANDILTTISICRRFGAPLLSRGGGTSLAGQCCNVAVVMDHSKYYNRMLAVDPDQKTATVEPGIVLDELRKATRRHGLIFDPDPATHSHCTIGGMLGNNSCGIHSVLSQFYGNGARTSDNTESLVIATCDGEIMKVGKTSDEEYETILSAGGRQAEIYRSLKALRDKYAGLIREKFPQIPRRVSGYNLPALLPENGFNVAQALVGSESTCVTILEATLHLIEWPAVRSLLVLGYPDVYQAAYAVPGLLKHKPVGLEGLDHLLIGYMRKKGLHENDIPLLPEGKGWLLVEFAGDNKNEADRKAKEVMNQLAAQDDAPSMILYDNAEEEAKLWEIRESGLGATAWVPGEPMSVPGWEDAAVPPERLGDYLKDFRKLLRKYDYNPSLYGHFGQGCIHCRIQFDLFTREGLDNFRQFTEEAARLVVSYGGSLSGEHGDGQSRSDFLEIMYGPELMQAFREFKAIWDPRGMMNPGKIVAPYGQLTNLRINNQYEPPALNTHFQFPDDNHDFSRATLRCVGVGKCRRQEGGTMCPSYMVTREEKDSTRGRARMLFEMLESEPLHKGWKNEAVKESLALCLACKGCKADCPVNVDMATYKSEFLSHYYEGRLRPRTAYAFGLINRWSLISSFMPGFINFLLHAPLVSRISKFAAGVEQKRTLPHFAEMSFREWFTEHSKRRTEPPGQKEIILWVDTFNNYFLPETLVAATEFLENAGYQIYIPQKRLCCGRPLYDFGMLDTAKAYLRKILLSLREEIREDIPIVALEPSCAAVFRDELLNLFPNDEDARRLSKNVLTLAEFLEKEKIDIPSLKGKALVHGHCQHKAVMKLDSDTRILKKTGMHIEVLDSGCCGMAGYFGYEKGDHYEVSIKAGERVLLPAVRKAPTDTLVIADGFSCREQIEQETGRKALHLAQVLQMGMDVKNGGKQPDQKPETEYVDRRKLKDPNKQRNRFLFGAALVGSFLAVRYLRNRKH